MTEMASGAVLSVTKLPPKLSSFPNHVAWINELVKFVEGAAPKGVISAEEYIKGRLSKENDDDEPTTEGQAEEQLDKLKRVAKTFNRAAMMIYVKQDHKEVPEILEQLRKSTDNRPPRLRHKPWDITEDLIDSLRCACAIMISKEGNLDTEEKDEPWWEEYVRLSEKWMDLQSCNLVKATLSFFKGMLCRQLDLKEEQALKYYLEATRLDPECHLWSHWAYRSKRRIRRDERGVGPRGLKDPSPEEEALAWKAYRLCRTDLIAITDYALVLKDKLWTKDRHLWNTHEYMVTREMIVSTRTGMSRKECVVHSRTEYSLAMDLFRDALRLAKNSGNKPWEVTLTVYIAEFLAFGKKDKIKEKEGRRLLEELAKKYPPNTLVLHKLGKVYYKGVGGEISKVRAAACFQKAIELCPTNFGCIMDYLKLKLLEAKGALMGMVKVCDEALEHCKRDVYKEKLTAKRAAIRARLYQGGN